MVSFFANLLYHRIALWTFIFRRTHVRIKLCGYSKRQDYIIESVLHQKITAIGNPYMFIQFKKYLLMIKNEIENSDNLKDNEKIISCMNTMCEILKAFEERKE